MSLQHGCLVTWLRTNRQIRVYTFSLISTCLSLSDEAKKIQYLILKEHNNVSYLRNFHPGIPNILEEIFFEKLLALQRMYELIRPPNNFVAFECLYFLCYCLQRAHFGTVCVARRCKLLLFFLFKIQITWPGIP